MGQDVTKIIDVLNAEWANDMLIVKKRMAVLIEENSRLKEEVMELKSGKEDETDAN